MKLIRLCFVILIFSCSSISLSPSGAKVTYMGNIKSPAGKETSHIFMKRCKRLAMFTLELSKGEVSIPIESQIILLRNAAAKRGANVVFKNMERDVEILSGKLEGQPFMCYPQNLAE